MVIFDFLQAIWEVSTPTSNGVKILLASVFKQYKLGVKIRSNSFNVNNHCPCALDCSSVDELLASAMPYMVGV